MKKWKTICQPLSLYLPETSSKQAQSRSTQEQSCGKFLSEIPNESLEANCSMHQVIA